ncbi:MAG TPA: hypothetical protein VMF67_04505 [Rhizomicrobium sp.]|nr:hypothetical protein [Rhizomicrobium sp.]
MQQFAAGAMQFGFEGAVANSIDGRQCLVNDRKGAPGIAGPDFGLGQGDLDEPIENQRILLAKAFRAATHALETVGKRAAVCGSPAVKKLIKSPEQAQVVLAHDPGEFGGARPDARKVASH